MDKINPQGFAQLMQAYISNLITRKRVAMFTDYQAAKEDIIIEIIVTQNFDAESAKAVRYAIEEMERITYVEDWFNEL